MGSGYPGRIGGPAGLRRTVRFAGLLLSSVSAGACVSPESQKNRSLVVVRDLYVGGIWATHRTHAVREAAGS